VRRQPDGLRSTRRSRSFYPVNDPQLAERMRAVSFEGYYTYLLYQDLDFVMPYELHRESDPEVLVVGPDADRATPLRSFQPEVAGQGTVMSRLGGTHAGGSGWA
jgi:hypothetical protein